MFSWWKYSKYIFFCFILSAGSLISSYMAPGNCFNNCSNHKHSYKRCQPAFLKHLSLDSYTKSLHPSFRRTELVALWPAVVHHCFAGCMYEGDVRNSRSHNTVTLKIQNKVCGKVTIDGCENILDVFSRYTWNSLCVCDCRRKDNGWSVTEQPVETCGCILALFHEITFVVDAGATGSSCFALCSLVTGAGTGCTLGMGRGAHCRALIVFVLWGWAQRILRLHQCSWHRKREMRPKVSNRVGLVTRHSPQLVPLSQDPWRH